MNWVEVARLALAEAERFDDRQDCTCADSMEGSYNCWYRLTDEEQHEAKLRAVAAYLEVDFGG